MIPGEMWGKLYAIVCYPVLEWGQVNYALTYAENPVLLVLPADHVIDDTAHFIR